MRARNFAAAKHGIEARARGSELRQILKHGLSAHLAQVIERVLAVESRELVDQLPAEIRREKLINHDMTEGRCR